MSRKLKRLRNGFGELPRVNVFDRERVHRPRKLSGKPQRFGRGLVGTPDERREHCQPFERIDCGRHLLSAICRVERASDPLVQFGIADRDQPRQEQSRAAHAHEGVRHRPHRAVVRKQDSAAGKHQRIGPEPINPLASESAKDRWIGMVKTAGRTAPASGISEEGFRLADRCRRSDVEPQALVNGAEATAGLDRLVP
jgi:hypothetical protein